MLGGFGMQNGALSPGVLAPAAAQAPANVIAPPIAAAPVNAIQGLGNQLARPSAPQVPINRAAFGNGTPAIGSPAFGGNPSSF